MQFDLVVPKHMTNTVGLLYAAIIHNYERLQSIISTMSQEELDYKGPEKCFNSTAVLISHLMLVDLHWVYRIRGEMIPEHLRARFGAMIDEQGNLPHIEGLDLQYLLDGYDKVIRLLEDACAVLSERDLLRRVRFGHQLEKEATIRWGLWHMADHSRYHQAHINQLRKWYSHEQSYGGK